ncbi:hypothetical protein H6F75_00450 [Nodosilinea sp. FACHB-131]|uniref:hypothetical protein n=1 Tax=Cyanophyceae TaxID=3028117 RepID=UPI001683936E|nr:hypothetical protein [Nodosilinea sp. FACHB-131]MBD1871940.1 hypothetical protein [Nodosilinea sp. FACHB-131]
MSQIIEAYKPLQIRLDHSIQVQFWLKVIEGFQDEDCDTLDECIDGKQVPSSYKEAYFKLNPWTHGYRTGCGLEPGPNPWDREEFSDQWERWNDGYAEGD